MPYFSACPQLEAIRRQHPHFFQIPIWGGKSPLQFKELNRVSILPINWHISRAAISVFSYPQYWFSFHFGAEGPASGAWWFIQPRQNFHRYNNIDYGQGESLCHRLLDTFNFLKIYIFCVYCQTHGQGQCELPALRLILHTCQGAGFTLNKEANAFSKCHGSLLPA